MNGRTNVLLRNMSTHHGWHGRPYGLALMVNSPGFNERPNIFHRGMSFSHALPAG
jgi:hypothetical protein